MHDPLSDVLRLVRLKSCVYFSRDFWSPWGMRLGGGGVAQFHAVLQGDCVVSAAGRAFHGKPGDVFLFPKGEPHVISDSEGSDGVPGLDFMQSLQTDMPLFSKGAQATRLLCGHYEYRVDVRHPLFEDLPPVVHVKAFDSYAPDTMRSILPVLIGELNAERPGATVVVEKLAEVLLVQVIRAHIDQDGRSPGFLAGLSDRRLAKAMLLIHGEPDRSVSLGDMAMAAGMSRSAFSARFRSVVGMAPAAYLTLWRMCRAQELLELSVQSVSQVAVTVGYESEIAFSRAYKRHFGATPGKVRRQSRLEAMV